MKQRSIPEFTPVNLAIAIGVAMTIWILSGVLFSGDDDTEDTAAIAALQDFENLLHIEEITPELRRRTAFIYGETEADREVALQAQTQGEVTAIIAKEGERIAKGASIISIDPRERPQRLAEAQATLALRQIEFKAAKTLQSKGFQSEIRLAEARKSLAEARAILKQAQLDMAFTTLRSPIDGLLEKINIDVGDFTGVGVFGVEGAIARVADLDPIIARGQVTQADRAFVDMGKPAQVRLGTGSKMEGEIRYLGKVAEKTSRSFLIEVAIPNPDYTISAGLTAEISVPLNDVSAYAIPASALSLNDAGVLGMKVVDAEQTVRFIDVQVMEESAGKVWVSGAEGPQRIIVRGHPYVSDGQSIAQKTAAPAAEAE